MDALGKEGIPASIIGEVLPGSEGVVIEERGREHRLEHPRTDPFWARFEEYLKRQNSDAGRHVHRP